MLLFDVSTIIFEQGLVSIGFKQPQKYAKVFLTLKIFWSLDL
jgi:hypothetical protein